MCLSMSKSINMRLVSEILLILTLLAPYCYGSPYLLFANRKDIRLVDAEARRKNSSVIVISHLEDAASLDYYHAEERIFWADAGLEEIKGMNLHEPKSNRSIITTGLIAPDGIACDWIGKKLYWIDSETNRIEVSEFNGSNRRVLFWKDLDQPRALALVPMDGWILWADWGETPKIEKAGMDGSEKSRVVIVSKDIVWPNGIAVEYATKTIFWADAKLKIISSMDFDGHKRRVVASGNLPHPFAITIFQGMLYWTDWQTRAVHSCNINSGCSKRTTFGGFLSPMGIHVYHKDRQPTSGATPCDTANGGCSHLCLLSPYEPYYSCACPTGIRIQENGKTCAEGPRELLLLVRKSDLRKISLDTPDYTDVVLELRGIKHAIAIDYDPVENYIYWSDDEAQAIRRVHLNGTGQEDLILTEVHHPDGIAVDWVARNLYWTDTGTDRIEVARLNGSSRKILIAENLDEPRAIVLDPKDGYLYWTDWGDSAKIERAALDGTMRSVLVNSSLGWPNGLAIDYEERMLYWGDAKTDKIEMSNLDGSHRRELVSDQLPHIFGFSLLGNSIYWTDWQRRSIERVDKVTGVLREVLVDQLPDLMGLKAINVNHVVYGTNLCAFNNGNCTHLCLNRPQSDFVCSCPFGMELSSDNQTCVVPEAFLLFSRKDNIRRISLESNKNDVIPISGVQEANALDYDINDFRIYWTDTGLKTISRAFINGSNVEPVIEFGLSYPEGMAVDWVAHNLYWTDMGSNRIEVSRIDGSSRKVLLWKHMDDPRSLAIDPTEGFIYWSDWGTNCRIERAAMDGSQRKILIAKLGRSNGLTIDYVERRIYWIDINALKIESSDLTGNYRRQIIGENLFDPYGLTQYEDFIYWTDWKTNTIERANKSSGENRTLIQKNLDHVMDILIFHTSRQSGWNPCAVHNGGCENLCLALPSSIQHKAYTCGCPTHFSLASDNKTCIPPQQFLLFSQKNSISRILVDSGDSPDITLPIHGLKNVKSLQYDPLEQFVYWINGRTKAIRKGLTNGTKISSVVPSASDQLHPYDLALDPFSRVLYYSCSLNNYINVTTLSGTPLGTIVRDYDDRPRSIALHPLKGLLFWSNMIHPPRIEVSTLNGHKRRTLFSTELEHPASLTIDIADDLLFWSDLGLRKIESSTTAGLNRKVILSNELLQPVSLTILGPFIYWVDQDQEVIEKVNKITGKDRQRVQGRMSLLTDLISVNHFNPQQYSNHPCFNKKNVCSHLCVVENGKKRCTCPLDLVLSTDDSTCVLIPTCPTNQFRCLSGVTCLPDSSRCDGISECDDMSDEMNCLVCKPNQFRCLNGDCIDKKYKCDGIPHCKDYTDEQCCEKNQFFCANAYQCISAYLVCDGNKDCDDASDENAQFCALTPSQKQLDTVSRSIPIYSVVVIMVVLVMMIGIVVVYLCKRKKALHDNGESLDVMMASNPLCAGPQSTCSNGNRSRLAIQQSQCGASGCVTTSLCTSRHANSGCPLYERSHVTGASSSSSSGNYPRETQNPPPSPVTVRSECMYSYCCNTPSSVRTYRHYRARNRPPPPTPCSTDVCDDSEPYPQRSCYCTSGMESSYDSDPFIPPPPTPRSQCLSDENYEASCPPSPRMDSNYYYNPNPPPPSPVPESDY